MEGILDRIYSSPVLFDGAMGTMIYSKGIYINTCYDNLCVTEPNLVQDIHTQYAKAGAQVLETNSFGANRLKLASFGLADAVRDINIAAANIARKAAGDSLFVAGAIGPCLESNQLLAEEGMEAVRAAFEEQARALSEGGVDFFILETFSNPDELALAIQAAATIGKPIFACVTVGSNGQTNRGTRIETIVERLDGDEKVSVLGINCGIGPAHAADVLGRALPLTSKPFLVMPNAGFPREVGGRMIYMTSADYFGEYVKRFIQAGVHAVGGCCGTTPEHIASAARAIQSSAGLKKHVEVHVKVKEVRRIESVPTEAKSRIAGKLYNGEKITMVELLPPRSVDLTSIVERARKCYIAGVDAINIPDGPRASCRVSPLITAISIRDRVGIETVIHSCCRDRNIIGMQSDLLGAFVAGISNFLFITGDPPRLGEYPEATGVFDVDAVGLIRLADNLNHGTDLGGSPINPPTALFIGMGANPCAVDLDHEIDRYRRKLDAGAEFVVTQPVFMPEALFHFLDRLQDMPRQIPIVAGIWPLTSLKNAEFMRNEVPGVEVPDAVMERMAKYQTREESLMEGIRIAREIIEAIQERIDGIQVSAPMGNVEAALKVLGKIPMDWTGDQVA